MIMIRKFLLVLSLILAFNSIASSQNVFDLKGKRIIIPPTVDDDWASCIYTDDVLSEYKFKDKYVYNEDILGDVIEVLDVIHINIGEKDEAILLVINHNANRVVLYMPMQWNRHKEWKSYLYECFYTDIKIEARFFSVRYYTNLENISLQYYDISIIDKFENNYVYMVSERYRDENLHFQTKYKFVGRNFDEKRDWYSKDKMKKMHIILESANGYIVDIPISTQDIISSSALTLEDFEECFQLEEDFIENSKKRYSAEYIESLKNKYVGKEVYTYSSRQIGNGKEYWEVLGENVKGDWSPNGEYYLCKDICLSRTNLTDPYFWYYAILEGSEGEVCYFPITDEFEKYVIYADIQRRFEAEEALKQAQKEAERLAEIEREERAYRNKLINKFGKRRALLILEGKVELGFTKEMCAESWGAPYDINRTITRYSVSEQWVYGLDCYLYFEGDKLVAIQNSESSSYYW